MYIVPIVALLSPKLCLLTRKTTFSHEIAIRREMTNEML